MATAPPPELSGRFPRYTEFNPLVPVWRITPEDMPGCIHRFFDTSPVSPSGRYVGLTRLLDETRPPVFGDEAEIVVVDLAEGEARPVARTRGFDAQLGANVQWGRDDGELYFNDLDLREWRPFAVRMDIRSGEKAELGGPVYMVSPDGSKLASPCLLRTALTQGGYGVAAPASHIPLNEAADPEDGLYMTDAATGECSLLVSLAEVVDALPELASEVSGRVGAFYGFHVKWNRQGDRLMFVVRHRPRRFSERLMKAVVTMKADGSDIRLAMPCKVWDRGGHHPDWCPDGEHVLQNLAMEDKSLRFVRFRYDGSGLVDLAPGVVGGGHPTLHPNGKHILTDAYQKEPFAYGDGTTPLRWVDLPNRTEQAAVRIRTRPEHEAPLSILRVDPHPAWAPCFRRAVFNACPEGRRHVFLADFSGALGG